MSFKKTFSNLFYIIKKHKILFISLNILFIFLYFLFINLQEAINIFTTLKSLTSLSLPLLFSVKIFFLTLFNYSTLTKLSTFILVALTLFSTAILFTLFFALWQKTKELNPCQKEPWKLFIGFLGMFFSVLGFNCLPCASGLLILILSFLGLASYVTYLTSLPLQGQEIGFLGVIMINIMNYILLKRIISPNVC